MQVPWETALSLKAGRAALVLLAGELPAPRGHQLLPSPSARLIPSADLPSPVPFASQTALSREKTFLLLPLRRRNTACSCWHALPSSCLTKALAGFIQTQRQAQHPLALFQTTVYCLGKLVLTAREMSGRHRNGAENSSRVVTAPDGTGELAAQACPGVGAAWSSWVLLLQEPSTS